MASDYDDYIEQRLREVRYREKEAAFFSRYSSAVLAPKPQPLVTGSATGRFSTPPPMIWSFACCPCSVCSSARGDEGTQTPLHPSARRQRRMRMRLNEYRAAGRAGW